MDGLSILVHSTYYRKPQASPNTRTGEIDFILENCITTLQLTWIKEGAENWVQLCK
jgi:hypothetical protein